MNILIITDHRTHSSIESIYPLARSIADDIRADRVACITRGDSVSWDTMLEGKHPKARIVDSSFSSATPEVWARNYHEVDLQDFPVVFMRMDRPFDEAIACQLGECFHGKLVVNSLFGMLNTGRKSALPSITSRRPPMHVCRSANDLEGALQAYTHAVIKHDETFGARGVYLYDGTSIWMGDKHYTVEEFISNISFASCVYVVVPFLKGITKGDKRLLVTGGELISATNRLPREGGWLANLRHGATAYADSATEDELIIVHQCNSVLRSHGVILYSIDTIEADSGTRVVSEINTLNAGILPTGDGRNVATECKAVASEFLSFVQTQFST